MLKNRKLFTTMLIAMFMVVMGCAEERPPRSYVQPHVLAKTDFTGDWYYAPTVVDVGFASTVTFIGELLGPQKADFGEGMTVRAGYQAKAKISRKEFGLKFNMLAEGTAVVSDEVEIIMEIEMFRKG